MGSINVRVMYGVAVRVGAELENLMPFFVQSAYLDSSMTRDMNGRVTSGLRLQMDRDCGYFDRHMDRS
jgi:hypothetical protein